jgi:hypothetical protein
LRFLETPVSPNRPHYLGIVVSKLI